ncbi:hypothetical protein [Methylocucumis oryzae]|uniref:Uncharacterized protein n=1 Tax=Methylocucumis oryzae TaxID=1632867 RepID=A0A0F3IMV6_9GAMM|nr:hypothetical protein [Methylocucumis oryzae]KJV08050.1 hypothetical protein VZ94_00365 [Methylocucumis oryzae]
MDNKTNSVIIGDPAKTGMKANDLLADYFAQAEYPMLVRIANKMPRPFRFNPLSVFLKPELTGQNTADVAVPSFGVLQAACVEAEAIAKLNHYEEAIEIIDLNLNAGSPEDTKTDGTEDDKKPEGEGGDNKPADPEDDKKLGDEAGDNKSTESEDDKKSEGEGGQVPTTENTESTLVASDASTAAETIAGGESIATTEPESAGSDKFQKRKGK